MRSYQIWWEILPNLATDMIFVKPQMKSGGTRQLITYGELGREAKRTVDINDCPYKYLLTLAERNILLKLVDLSLTLSTD